MCIGSLGCSLLRDTRLSRGTGGLWGCLSSPGQDGEGGGRHWEWSPVLGRPGLLSVSANRTSLSRS